jgi:DNA repair exonuclease SbcCD ATPase subunit
MSAYRLLICCIAALFLSACGPNESGNTVKKPTSTSSNTAAQEHLTITLTRENADLQSQLNNDYNGKVLKSRQMEKEAAIAQACMQPFNINFCPSSVTKAGEAVIKNNISGGANPYLWPAYLLKFIFILVIFIILVFVPLELWSKRIKPNLTAKERTDNDVAESRATLELMNDRIKYLKEEMAILEKKLALRKEEVEQELIDLESENEEKIKSIEETFKEKFENNKIILKNQDDEIKQKDSSIQALKAFEF